VGTGITLDGAANAYVTGSTMSDNFPRTSDALQGGFSGGLCFYFLPFGTVGCGDGFLTQFNLRTPGSGTIVYSTYFGGSRVDAPVGVALDAAGSIVIVGTTVSDHFPVTGNAFQSSLFGQSDAFVVKFLADHSAPSSSTERRAAPSEVDRNARRAVRPQTEQRLHPGKRPRASYGRAVVPTDIAR
jgi:hypothetical protein